jgi:hypothetical protein
MNRVHLLTELETKLFSRNPKIKAQLSPGLSTDVVEARLAKVEGIKTALLDLYRWHNGTDPIRFANGGRYIMSYAELSFSPQDLLIFPTVDLMLAHFGSWFEAARSYPNLKDAAKYCFPFLWDGGTSWLALDLRKKYGERVMAVEFQSDRPVREAYSSFDECLLDLIRANRDGDGLRFT